MNASLDCVRAEELLGPAHEGTLDRLQQRDLDAHLRACDACRALQAGLADVHDILRPAPLPEASLGLEERIVRATFGRRVVQGPWGLPRPVLAAAAGLALAASAALLFAWGATTGRFEAAARLADRPREAGIYVAERTDRAVESFRLLRVVLETAFEARIERVQDRVEDYRRLVERRRAQEKAQQGGRRDDVNKTNSEARVSVTRIVSGTHPGATPGEGGPRSTA